jgi:redox-sensitive bicupin YhaK (pirin superfamily)
MMRIRPARERGRTSLSWLESYHSFSFGDYYDPDHMGFQTLRVINDDRVAPGGGFATHGHRDMEIITYVLEGTLEHKDSLGNGSIIAPGDAQRMTAGTGILHSELNHSQNDPVHLLQIWILPARPGLPPGYEQRPVPAAEKRDRLRLIASPDGRSGSVTVHQAVDVYAAVLQPGGGVTHTLAPARHVWVQVAGGAVELNGKRLDAGDGAALSDERELAVRSNTGGEILLFDLA